MIDEGGISIWSGYKPHQHNLKWLAESECVGIWKTKIRTLILVDCRSVLLSFVCKTIVNIVLGNLVPVPHQMLFVLIYIAAATAFAQILPLSVLQDLTNSNIKRRILYDAIQAAAVIPFATTYFRSADFRKTETPSKWIPWGLIGVCAILVTIILPERVYAFWFYLIIVGCGEEFVFRGYLHRELRKAFNFKVSVILGGLVFGFAHGYSHFMVLGGTITGILSELGGGIVGALIFSAIYEKSNSIGWPILIHACLDFTGYLV